MCLATFNPKFPLFTNSSSTSTATSGGTAGCSHTTKTPAKGGSKGGKSYCPLWEVCSVIIITHCRLSSHEIQTITDRTDVNTNCTITAHQPVYSLSTVAGISQTASSSDNLTVTDAQNDSSGPTFLTIGTLTVTVEQIIATILALRKARQGAIIWGKVDSTNIS